jgi:predicted GNAT superfamily acetyltransferase
MTCAGDRLTIRDVEGFAEMKACEELQREVWGFDDLEVVSSHHLLAAREVGGVLVGAFDGESLVGFAYGFVGLAGGELEIHSHMLAVKPAYRNDNLGYRLKLAQRERALASGIAKMTWTFDPLQSLNAHFNFNKLGVVSDRYLVNFYGEATSSFLHQGIGTDRLWVSWLLDSARVKRRLGGRAEGEGVRPELEKALPLVSVGADGSPQSGGQGRTGGEEYLSIEIPGDIAGLQREQPNAAVEWREATRRAFTEALGSGYRVEEFYRRSRSRRPSGVYLLSLKPASHFDALPALAGFSDAP